MTAACTGWYVTTLDLGAATGLQAVFNNGSGTWDNNNSADYLISSGTSNVVSSTHAITSGNPCSATSNSLTVFYYNASTWSNVYMHYAPTGGSWTTAPGVAMTVECGNWHKKVITLGPATGAQLTFNNGSGAWDSNGGSNYQVGTGYIKVASGTVTANAVNPCLPIGTEPTLPYAQPADSAVPKRGCATIDDPAAPASTSINAVQVIYGYNAAWGNHYDDAAAVIAKIMDRVDWAIDESSDYEQHINFSCRHTDDGTYADYAKALVAPVLITSGTSSGQVRADLAAAGYSDTNRWYVVFADFDSQSDSYLCPTTGGYNCSSVVTDSWDTGVAGHEFGHLLGAGHAWMTETGHQYNPDIMLDWGNYWLYDTRNASYYDPSETAARFYIDPYSSTTKANIAAHPVLTTPVCCDVGANNDLLTAQERTTEADAPGASPTGYSAVGGATLTVTPAGSYAGVSASYFDGRRSLQVTTAASAASGYVITRQPVAVAGTTYKQFVRLRSATTTATVALRMQWFDSSGTLLSTTTSNSITLTSNWLEWRLTGTAPTGTATVQLGVIAPAQTSFTMNVDTQQLNRCDTVCRIET